MQMSINFKFFLMKIQIGLIRVANYVSSFQYWVSIRYRWSDFLIWRSSIPIRKIVELLLLKRMFNGSDESVVDLWKEHPYWQYLYGEMNFQHHRPFDQIKLIMFCNRVEEFGIIIWALDSRENLYDADTFEPHLKKVERLTGRLSRTSVVDRDYRGRKKVRGVEIRILIKPMKNATNHEKQKVNKLFKARAEIEHVKHDHRMVRNYLNGTQGDMANSLFATARFNMMKMRSCWGPKQNFEENY